MPSIGENIRSLRKSRGWTQPELAKRVNRSPQVISNWERGYTSLDHDDVAKLATAFDVKTDMILLVASEKGKDSKQTPGRAHRDNSPVEDDDSIVIKHDEPIYTVVARSKNLPPQKIKKLEKLLDLLFDEEDDNQ